MAEQNDLDLSYLRMAYIWSNLSQARRKKVGCLIVKNGTIISDGFNGSPSGFDNDCESWLDGSWVTNPETLHAESNAITKLAKSTQSSDGATIYTTCVPCLECAKLIIQSGINRVVFRETYRKLDGLLLLKRANIDIKRIKIINE